MSTSGSDQDGGHRHRVHLPVGGWSLPVDVIPPESGAGTRRTYPIPAGPDHGPADIEASVLYTRGLTVDDAGRTRSRTSARPSSTGPSGTGPGRDEAPFQHWFVKAYWCATPQEAGWLREHFQQQGNDILEANSRLNGSALTPPWAVAPIWVVAAGRGRGSRATTHLGADAEGVLESPDARLWDWFGITDNPQPENCFLVLAKYLPRPMPFVEARRAPRTDQLQELEAVARGLDMCHRAGIAHCDVKPDNIRVHSVGAVRSFVLVDADAVLRLDAMATKIRRSQRFTHPRLQAWLQAGGKLTGEHLAAHDRYGFALVALGAVAGTATTDALIDRIERNPDGSAGAEVRALLRGGWGGRTWDPMIEALAAPFDQPFDRHGDWSNERWVLDLIRGTAEPVDDGLVRRYRRDIDDVRRGLPAALVPAEGPDAVVDSTTYVAYQLALRKFRLVLLPWILVPVLVALLIAYAFYRGDW